MQIFDVGQSLRPCESLVFVVFRTMNIKKNLFKHIGRNIIQIKRCFYLMWRKRDWPFSLGTKPISCYSFEKINLHPNLSTCTVSYFAHSKGLQGTRPIVILTLCSSINCKQSYIPFNKRSLRSCCWQHSIHSVLGEKSLTKSYGTGHLKPFCVQPFILVQSAW